MLKKVEADITRPEVGPRQPPPVSAIPILQHGRANFPQFSRVEKNGKVAVLINDGNGWIIHCEQGALQNPWTKAPFRILEHCRSAAKYFLRRGRWPKIKP